MAESLLSESTENTETEAAVETPEVTPTSSDRPAWLPEKYKTGEDLAKAYKELESKLGTKEADLRKAIMDEIQQEAYKDRPASAGEYSLPDIIDSEEAVDNELLRWWSEHAFENGYGQAEFEKGIEMYAQAMEAQNPRVDLEQEAKKLGDNASQRIDAASAFVRKNFSKEHFPAIERLFESAEGVMVMEVIMDKMKDGNFSVDTTPQPRLTQADLNEMMRDPRYGLGNSAQRDMEYVKQVDAAFKSLYG